MRLRVDWGVTSFACKVQILHHHRRLVVEHVRVVDDGAEIQPAGRYTSVLAPEAIR